MTVVTNVILGLLIAMAPIAPSSTPAKKEARGCCSKAKQTATVENSGQPARGSDRNDVLTSTKRVAASSSANPGCSGDAMQALQSEGAMVSDAGTDDVNTGADSDVTVLSESLAPLREHFNAYKDKDRFIAILSPT